MNINLKIFVPDNLSDQSAYHIIQFLSEIAFAFENYYFISGNSCTKEADDLHKATEDEPPF